MSQLRNHVQLVGHLGKEVDYRSLENGRAMAKVSIATTDFYRNAKGEDVETVQWHNLLGWGPIAERMHTQWKKGQKMVVHGKLTHRSYEDQTGRTKYLSEIVVHDFIQL